MRTINLYADPMMRPMNAQACDGLFDETLVRTTPIPLPEPLTAMIVAAPPLDTESAEDDMTTEEAEAHTKAIQESEVERRVRVYLMWKHNGWKKMKASCSSFQIWCQEWIDTNHDTAYKWCQQIQNTLDAKGIKVCTLYTFEKENLLPRTTTDLLQKLKTPEDRRQAFKEIEALRKWGTRTPGEVTNALKHIVNRMTKPEEEQKQIAPPPAPIATMPVDLPAPVALDTQRNVSTSPPEFVVTGMSLEDHYLVLDQETPDGRPGRTRIERHKLQDLLKG